MGFIKFEVKNYIAVVTLDRPPNNAFSLEMYREIGETFNKIDAMIEARVVILRAEGRDFSVGNDLRDLERNSGAGKEHRGFYVETITRALMSIHHCKLPLICAVQGYAVGAGCAMAASGDIIIASEDASFILPEVKVGIIGAAGFLSLIAPEKVVRYMSLTGNPVSVCDLGKYGGIHKIVPRDRLYETSLEVAHELLNNPPLTIKAFKEALNLNSNFELEKKYRNELKFTDQLSATYDRKEAIKARLEKRVPVFKGE